MRAEPVDVLVCGAGPVGCAAALSLRACGLRVALRDDGAPASPPFRPLALSYASRLILERIGAWPPPALTAIETIEVSQAGGFGLTRLTASDAAVPALGYVADYAGLVDLLRTAAHELFVTDSPPARCTVHAEGSAPDGQAKRYAQDAVVARVHTEPPSRSTAFERFTAEGPLALLPFAGAYAVVWSASPARASTLSEHPETFVRALAAATGGRCGRPVRADSLAVQPLFLRVRDTRTAARAVYIGNAAQTLHPVAGQGLNLGLRDAWDLACTLREAADPGDAATLARYAARRRIDAGATVRVTDTLARVFLGSSRTARAARGIALTALDVLPVPRRFFARRMIFGPSALP